MRNFATKVNDTAPLASGILDANEDNVRFEELETAVTASGIALDAQAGPDTRLNMLAESMMRHAAAAVACTDSGAANAYVLSIKGSYVAPTALVDEMCVRFKPGHAGTGAATVNAFGLGIRPLVDHTYAPLVSGAIDGRDIQIIYRASVGASGSWVLPAWANALLVGTAPTSPPSVSAGEGWSVDGSNHGNLNFPGLTNLGTVDPSDVFARYVSAGGVNHHRGITGAQLLAAVAGAGGLIGFKVITSSSTYTKAEGATKALVIAIGGGGGGGGYQTNPTGEARGGCGGASGGMAMAMVDLSAVATVAVLIGAGGTPGAPGNGNYGGAGGTTSFGSYAVATGGGGGYSGGNDTPNPYGNNYISPAPGVGTAGDLVIRGNGVGRPGWHSGTPGAGSFLGGGGQSGNAGVAGGDGMYGGGGGGAALVDNTPKNGGAGGGGIVLVLEFA